MTAGLTPTYLHVFTRYPVHLDSSLILMNAPTSSRHGAGRWGRWTGKEHAVSEIITKFCELSETEEPMQGAEIFRNMHQFWDPLCEEDMTIFRDRHDMRAALDDTCMGPDECPEGSETWTTISRRCWIERDRLAVERKRTSCRIHGRHPDEEPTPCHCDAKCFACHTETCAKTFEHNAHLCEHCYVKALERQAAAQVQGRVLWETFDELQRRR